MGRNNLEIVPKTFIKYLTTLSGVATLLLLLLVSQPGLRCYSTLINDSGMIDNNHNNNNNNNNQEHGYTFGHTTTNQHITFPLSGLTGGEFSLEDLGPMIDIGSIQQAYQLPLPIAGQQHSQRQRNNNNNNVQQHQLQAATKPALSDNNREDGDNLLINHNNNNQASHYQRQAKSYDNVALDNNNNNNNNGNMLSSIIMQTQEEQQQQQQQQQQHLHNRRRHIQHNGEQTADLLQLIPAISGAITDNKRASGSKTCHPAKPFVCPSETPDSGECIPIQYLCDGAFDCPPYNGSPGGYDEDSRLCTAVKRPPVEDTANFLKQLLSQHGPTYIERLFGSKIRDALSPLGGPEKVAVALSVSRTIDDFGKALHLMRADVEHLRNVLVAVQNMDGAMLKSLGIVRNSDLADMKFFLEKLLSTGFLD